MSELTETEIISKISAIDIQIAAITDTFTATGGAANVDHEIGNKRIDASQKLEQLFKAREIYQGLLKTMPKTIIKNADYEIEQGTGEPKFEQIGDE